MTGDDKTGSSRQDDSRPDRRDLPPAARRALEEAAARRAARKKTDATAKPAPGEKGGPQGKEPTRYGDWERKGRAVDF